MKLMIVFGTRPEVIKLAPVVVAARETSGIEVITCSTGQHRQMLDQALSCFGLQPSIDLDLMRANQTLPGLTARLLEQITDALLTHRPDVVMVQGDTTTAFTGALAAFYQRISVAHVEPGLRTGDPFSPFPEEINRSMIARMARWHLTPTFQGTRNLMHEGIRADAITQCGNTVIDAVELIKKKWASHPYAGPANAWFPGRDLVLVTTHRRENLGQGLENICDAVLALCEEFPALSFVFPVHLNPQVQEVVRRKLAHVGNLKMTEPVDFETSLYLQSRSTLILTDSGGIQEEAPSFGVPTVVMRQHTERSEGVDAGFATLAGTECVAIVEAAREWLVHPEKRNALRHQPSPYGDGKASERVLKVLLDDFPATPDVQR